MELKRCFRVWVKGRFWFLFFCLVNLFTLEQIFAVVKIRHSSLILKEVLHNSASGSPVNRDKACRMWRHNGWFCGTSQLAGMLWNRSSCSIDSRIWVTSAESNGGSGRCSAKCRVTSLCRFWDKIVCIQCCRKSLNTSVFKEEGWLQSGLEWKPAPSTCATGGSQTPFVGNVYNKAETEKSIPEPLTKGRTICANLSASCSGYSAVRLLRKPPVSSLTPANGGWCPGGCSQRQAKEIKGANDDANIQDFGQFLPKAHAARWMQWYPPDSNHFWVQFSNQLMADGGCSRWPWPPAESTTCKSSVHLKSIRWLFWTRDSWSAVKLGRPSKNSWERNAGGPPGFSLSTLYSLQLGEQAA